MSSVKKWYEAISAGYGMVSTRKILEEDFARRGGTRAAFRIYDRGLLRPGLAAEITLFDPHTVGRG
jgi:N-acyl-D-aspartate/D-glutamate deacylase